MNAWAASTGWLQRKAATLDLRRTALRFGVMLAITGVAGCGGSGGRKTESDAANRIRVFNPMHLPKAIAQLAKLNINSKTVFYITATHCGERETDCYRLGDEAEGPVRFSDRTIRRLDVLGTGQQINDPGPAERVLLYLKGHEECVGETPVTVTYGILHDVNDTVSVRAGVHFILFKKAKIPSYMEPYGILVYALVPSGANEVLVRTPTGRVVSHERGSMTRVPSSCKG